MKADETATLIEAAGGDAAFARLLGIDQGFFQQRVNNWKRRGIPAAVELEHLEKLNDLRARVQQAGQSCEQCGGGAP